MTLKDILRKTVLTAGLTAGALGFAQKADAGMVYSIDMVADNGNRIAYLLKNDSSDADPFSVKDFYVKGDFDSGSISESGWAIENFSGIDIDSDGILDSGLHGYAQDPYFNLKPGDGLGFGGYTSNLQRELARARIGTEGAGNVTIDYTAPIPEPATLGLLGLGALLSYRRKQK